MNKKLKQYGTLVVGLLIGGGFAFGGIASYSSMNAQQNTQQNDRQEFNATLPESNFQEGSFGLSLQEMKILAVQNDVSFVNLYYENQAQKQQLEQLSSLNGQFGGRTYIAVINSTERDDINSYYSLTQFPRGVVVGGTRGQRGSIVADPSQDKVSRAICNSFDSLGDQAANCL